MIRRWLACRKLARIVEQTRIHNQGYVKRRAAALKGLGR